MFMPDDPLVRRILPVHLAAFAPAEPQWKAVERSPDYLFAFVRYLPTASSFLRGRLLHKLLFAL
jgi:hypothetical protein